MLVKMGNQSVCLMFGCLFDRYQFVASCCCCSKPTIDKVSATETLKSIWNLKVQNSREKEREIDWSDMKLKNCYWIFGAI